KGPEGEVAGSGQMFPAGIGGNVEKNCIQISVPPIEFAVEQHEIVVDIQGRHIVLDREDRHVQSASSPRRPSVLAKCSFDRGQALAASRLARRRPEIGTEY